MKNVIASSRAYQAIHEQSQASLQRYLELGDAQDYQRSTQLDLEAEQHLETFVRQCFQYMEQQQLAFPDFACLLLQRYFEQPSERVDVYPLLHLLWHGESLLIPREDFERFLKAFCECEDSLSASHLESFMEIWQNNFTAPLPERVLQKYAALSE